MGPLRPLLESNLIFKIHFNIILASTSYTYISLIVWQACYISLRPMRATCASLFRANSGHTVFFVASGPGRFTPRYCSAEGWLVGSIPDLDALKRKCTAPFLTSNHGPSLYRLSYPDSTFPLFSSKYFLRCVFLSQTSVNTFQTLTTQKLSLHCVHVLVHILQTLRHRHVEHVSQSDACACSPHSSRNLHSHTHTFARPLCSAWVQCS
jgi:hypothetical protein